MDNKVEEGSFAENSYPAVSIHLQIRGPDGLETQKEAVVHDAFLFTHRQVEYT